MLWEAKTDCALYSDLIERGLRGCRTCEKEAIGRAAKDTPTWYKQRKLAAYLKVDELSEIALDERFSNRQDRIYDYSKARYVSMDPDNGILEAAILARQVSS